MTAELLIAIALLCDQGGTVSTTLQAACKISTIKCVFKNPTSYGDRKRADIVARCYLDWEKK